MPNSAQNSDETIFLNDQKIPISNMEMLTQFYKFATVYGFCAVDDKLCNKLLHCMISYTFYHGISMLYCIQAQPTRVRPVSSKRDVTEPGRQGE